MKPEELLELFSEVDGDLLRRSETATVEQKRRTPLRRSQLAVAACYVLISAALFLASLQFRDSNSTDAPVPGDISVSVSDSDGEVESASDSDLTAETSTEAVPDRPTVDLAQYAPATVDEVSFEQVEQVDASVMRFQTSLVDESVFWKDPDLLLFRGTVVSLRYLRIDYGQIRLREDYVKNCELYSIVFIVKLGEVYHGTVKSGEEISVYMTYIGRLGVSEFANQIYGYLTPGAEGIFGVRQVRDGSYYIDNDHIFYYDSVAQSILTAFTMIETDRSVVFPFPYYRDRAFSTLDEGEIYLRQKLEQYCA